MSASQSQEPKRAWSGIAGTASGQAENISPAEKWITEVRKLDPELLKDAGVVTRGDEMGFPYMVGDEVSGAKYRTIGKKFWSTPGVTRGVYGFNWLNREFEQPVVITEGEIDCLTVRQCGFTRCISLPDGWTEHGNKTDSLLNAEDLLRKSPFVVVAGDNDAAGESLPVAVANILKGHKVRAVTWPEGCKDANDVLVNLGPGELVAAIQAADEIYPKGGVITGFSDLPPMSSRRVLRSGVPLIDDRICFELGAMSVATGVPGHGKSTFVTWAANCVAQHEKIRVGLMGFETHPHRTRDHLARLWTGSPWDVLTADGQEHLAGSLDNHWAINTSPLLDDDTDQHLGWLKQKVYEFATVSQCKLIIIDPWNELEHFPEPGESMTQYINFALKEIRQWAARLEVHICVVAHPKKMDPARGYPSGYDIADSAAFFNKPAVGFTVHQAKTETGTPYVKLVTWKVRDTQLYQIYKGKSSARFDPDAMTYEALPELDQ